MPDPASEELATLVTTLLRHLGAECGVVVAPTDAGLSVAIETPQEAKFLIGREGQNLKAIEQVVRAMWTRRGGTRNVTIDVNGYRRERDQELAKNVHVVAARVRETRRPEALDPMNPYERRIVHTELAAYADLASESIGTEPHRRVVIKPL